MFFASMFEVDIACLMFAVLGLCSRFAVLGSKCNIKRLWNNSNIMFGRDKKKKFDDDDYANDIENVAKEISSRKTMDIHKRNFKDKDVKVNTIGKRLIKEVHTDIVTENEARHHLDKIIDLLYHYVENRQVERGTVTNVRRKRMFNEWIEKSCKNGCGLCEDCLETFKDIIEQ